MVAYISINYLLKKPSIYRHQGYSCIVDWPTILYEHKKNAWISYFPLDFDLKDDSLLFSGISLEINVYVELHSFSHYLFASVFNFMIQQWKSFDQDQKSKCEIAASVELTDVSSCVIQQFMFLFHVPSLDCDCTNSLYL